MAGSMRGSTSSSPLAAWRRPPRFSARWPSGRWHLPRSWDRHRWARYGRRRSWGDSAGCRWDGASER